MKTILPALEYDRIGGRIRYEVAHFDQVLGSCCGRPGARVTARIHNNPDQPDRYIPSCRDCAPRYVQTALRQRTDAAPILIEVPR